VRDEKVSLKLVLNLHLFTPEEKDPTGEDLYQIYLKPWSSERAHVLCRYSSQEAFLRALEKLGITESEAEVLLDDLETHGETTIEREVPASIAAEFGLPGL
jgi:hypothetical protein